MFRRVVVGGALVGALLLSGCGVSATPADDPTAAGSSAAVVAKESVSIGAVTIVSHPSLDLVYEGIQEGLAEAGYVEGENLTLDFQNPQGDQATLTSIANTFAASDKDLFVAIATPPAQALAQVIQDRPIVFASVTDPVAAGLVESMEAPGGNVTGTSDQLPVEAQLKLIRAMLPDATKTGIPYTTSATNSPST